VANAQDTAVEALVTRLRTIEGGAGGYAYTPTKVQRVDVYEDHCFDSSLDVIYLIRPGQERRNTVDSGNSRGDLEVFILVAKRHGDASETPFQQSSPSRWQVAGEMVSDVVQRLGEDNTLGAPGTVIDCIRGGIDVDYERDYPNWAIAEIRIQLHYHYATRGR
jgi:hypothetical protein